MKILCVGNSFAEDAASYVHEIGKCIGEDIDIHVLFIPGCPIDLHWKNFSTKDTSKAYKFFVNDIKVPLMYCDIYDGLNFADYDFVTFQQRSGDSGDENTFFPELTYLMNGLREYTKGTYLLHKTWSYAKTYAHDKYGHDPLDQDAMDNDIKNAYLKVSEKSGIKYIIPSGEAIKLARKVFGDELNRDGYHLNERGRTLISILWVMFLTGKTDLNLDNFYPSGRTYDDVTPPVDKKEIPQLIEIAKQALENNKGYNLYE